MFERGIRDPEFLDALKSWPHWNQVVGDKDLFIAMRKKTVNIYCQGCSLFEISYNGGLQLKTHFKYLVRPVLPSGNPYVTWNGDRPDIGQHAGDFFIDSFDIDALKKASSWYAEDEKEGIHKILKSNTNVIDVEIALSPGAEDTVATEVRKGKGRRVADRIDFAAIQERERVPCIVFFEAKRFNNDELRSKTHEPAVLEQIDRYEKFIRGHLPDFEYSYREVCQNLVALDADRGNELVQRVAQNPEQLKVDSAVRLVAFDFDEDQRVGKVWRKHHQALVDRLGKERLLLKGSADEFKAGISKYKSRKVAA
jgi:hypothetical protein